MEDYNKAIQSIKDVKVILEIDGEKKHIWIGKADSSEVKNLIDVLTYEFRNL